MIVFNVLLGFGAYGALFALFASIIALAGFMVWRVVHWLARCIGLSEEKRSVVCFSAFSSSREGAREKRELVGPIGEA